MKYPLSIRFVVSCVWGAVLSLSLTPVRAVDLDFNRDVRPILSEHCFECHGPDQATREADLRLDDADSALHVVEAEAGDAKNSELIRRIESIDADQKMPPVDFKKPLSAKQRQLLRTWVDQGATYGEHWAYVPPRADALPTTNDDWSRNPIDQFVHRRLAEENLKPSPPASPQALIRRISLDLNGLPPTVTEVKRFVKAFQTNAANAVEQLIDRRMHSSRYGEHMALPWLEASRYADTDGYQNDRYRYHHVWRDWVIQAFNDNMPYDQFVIEQIAGDMLPDATLTQQIATGFGRNHRINSEDGSIPEEWRTENVIDRVDTFGTLFLGLTVGCARCHDHKYDPISQKEYYQLFSYFNNIAEWGVGPNNGNTPPFIEVPESWPNLAATENHLIVPDPVELHSARKEAGNGLQRPQAGSPSTLMIMHELAEPRQAFVLVRGQYDAADETQPVYPNVPRSLASDSADSPSNRLELARWLFEDDHPLTARVAVNRIWQQFFGVGLVETSENFGSQGSQPSHPELLDWLALELIRNDWDVRVIQRLILCSQTYQQTSAFTEQLLQQDPKNRLLARGPRYRLPAFTLRDQALAVSGLLVERIGGPSAKPYMPPKIWSSISNNKYQQEKGANLYRRSLYTYWRRTIPPPTMMNFNAAPREVCIVRTERTNTPLQALSLMNNKLFMESARFLAQRMLRESNVDSGIQTAFQLTTARTPTDPELRLLANAHSKFLRHYRSDTSAANELLTVGESTRDKRLDPIQHAAMTMTASLILNLDETISKE
ncbi:MAG: PSD1 and planctomycete cytochrome C domain-containing protein [Rubripirellula sp.]